jgi:hypothetical protein
MAVWDPRGGGNVHIDVALTNISVGFPNNEFVGERLFPRVNVQKQSNKYYIFGREAWSTHLDVRAPGTEANEIPGYAVSTDSYFAVEHALQIAVTDEERENADSPFSPDEDGAFLVTQKVLLGREVAIKTLVTTTANYATTPTQMFDTLSGTAQWSDYVNSNPIADFRKGQRAINSQLFVDPNTAVVPYQVMSILEDHPDFIERIKYSERGILSPDLIGAVVGVPNIIMPSVGQNTAAMGQTPTLGYLWGRDVVMAWVPPNPGLRIPAFGYEFNWGYGAGLPTVTDRWRENNRKSDVIRNQRRYDLKLPAQDTTGKAIGGYVIKTAVAP